jgi:hypothetical protein
MLLQTQGGRGLAPLPGGARQLCHSVNPLKLKAKEGRLSAANGLIVFLVGVVAGE